MEDAFGVFRDPGMGPMELSMMVAMASEMTSSSRAAREAEALLKPKKARAPKKKKEVAPASPSSSAGPSSARTAIESDKENITKVVGQGKGKAVPSVLAKAPAPVRSVLAKAPAASGSTPSVHQVLMMAGQKRPAEDWELGKYIEMC
ncbi:hypothetical protein QFC20_007787 [Naganishia adeliensis]|uniref:Uncharacterized protein n=1 Tax=Naganishia adeliensis TaxID=92952 RepID=A0ACC2UVD2_9TREE|nr:hypothetical protein QFC20_007787 [Naganishia adeliensis]